MIKARIILLLLIGLSACTPHERPEKAGTVTEDKLPDSLLIKPGKSIGNIRLGDDMQLLLKQYGPPDKQDAAMGATAYTWFLKHDTTGYSVSVYGHRNFGGADENVLQIKKVMINTPDFITAEGIRTGADEREINKFYQLSDNSRYLNKGKPVRLFADIGKGISFTIDTMSKKCTGISIFHPGDTSAINININ